MTTPRASTGSHQGTATPLYVASRGAGAIVDEPDEAGQAEARPSRRRAHRRRARSGAGRCPRRRRPRRRTRSPTMPPSAQSTPMTVDGADGEDVEHQQQPGDRDGRPGDGQPGGRLAVARPEPADHGDRRGVLDQDGDRDRQPVDGVEVGELARRHRDQAEGQQEPGVRAQQVPPTAQGEQGRDQTGRARRPRSGTAPARPATSRRPGGRPRALRTGRRTPRPAPRTRARPAHGATATTWVS